MSNVDPIVIAEDVNPPTAEIRLRVPSDLEYFKGHFPGAPIVPGVVQVQWAVSFARRCLHVGEEFAGMEALKFHRVMGPGTETTLSLRYVPETGKLHFSFLSDSGRHSSGRVLLKTP